ncbi:MAG: pyruvate kinase PykF [Candidatus Makana argininalis]
MKKTKIVCTIGPKTESIKIISNLIDLGINVIRLNLSHGNHKDHKNRILHLRKILEKKHKKISIMLDTKGPEIRTMTLEKKKEVFLKSGQIFTFTTDKYFLGNKNKVAVNYKYFFKNLVSGNKILIDDGLLEMTVIKIINNEVICKVHNNGYLGENKGINIPDVLINISILSKQDKKDLIFGCKQGVDFIAASFIRNKNDVKKIRHYLNKYGGKNIKIFSKIENKEGLKNFDEILNLSDGIMIARGDLGVEIPIEDVIFAQKMIIKKCNLIGKTVITATQMLDSMIKNPRPTRAEAGDISNAIIDGTDAVMLSGESANGKYPLKSVFIMSNICKKTDSIFKNNFIEIKNNIKSITESVCFGAVQISKILKSPLIIVETESGQSAKSIRKYFPKSKILVLTNNIITAKQLPIIKGLYCQLIQKIKNSYDFYNIGKFIALDKNLAFKKDIIIMVSRVILTKGITNNISVHTI